MIFLQKGTLTRWLIHAIFSIALRLFFRRIETSHVDLVPMSGPVIFVLNHPNGLIDPALVFSSLPRRVSFLAKSTLFRLPILSQLLRAVDALPLFRRVDPGEDMTKNQRTFEACHALLRDGRCIALFPEGLSHSSTRLMPIKTGAARIALGAISVGGNIVQHDNLNLKIVPVGLYYTSKTSFRSEALIRFGEYIDVQPVQLNEQGEPPRDAVKLLSARIEAALHDVTLNVENDEALAEISRVEQLFSSIYESINIRQSLSAQFESLRRFAGQRARHRAELHTDAKELRQRIDHYEIELIELGITAESLSVISHSRGYVLRHFVLKSAFLMLLLPLSIIGALIHFPAYFFSNALAKIHETHGVDDIVSTVKILAAIVLMPLTWLAVAFLALVTLNWRVALICLPVTVICGYVAMRFVEEIVEMKGWFKAMVVLLSKRRLFFRLLKERRRLHNEIKRLGLRPENITYEESGESGSCISNSPIKR